jgi:hypothetical protein
MATYAGSTLLITGIFLLLNERTYERDWTCHDPSDDCRRACHNRELPNGCGQQRMRSAADTHP